MIIEIPSDTDFLEAGVDFLNIAWSSIIKMLLELEELIETIEEEKFSDNYLEVCDPNKGTIYERCSDFKEFDIKEVKKLHEDLINSHDFTQSIVQLKKEYWQNKSAQRNLSTSIVIVQQGIELLLKANIAKISSFLLLDGGVNDWSRNSKSKDIKFADLKTINAQDLTRAFDTVSGKKLSDSFKREYEETRKLRNTIMHSVNQNLELTAKQTIITILEAVEELLQPTKWLELRREFIKREPINSIRSYSYSYEMNDSPVYQIYRELEIIIDILEPSQLKKYFSFDKRARKYSCRNCFSEMGSLARDYDLNINLAQLKPNLPESTELYCIVCEEKREVRRANCINKECKSNVIDSEEGVCLICDEHQ